MTMRELLQGKTDCTCGKAHPCPIESVVIGKDAFDALGRLAKGYSHILLVADTNTYAVAGDKTVAALGDRVERKQIFRRQGLLIPNEEAIAEIEASLTEQTDLIVGVGSGVINDLCKHVSFKHSLPYFIVATAPSMDGYASVGAALLLDGLKVTLNAAVPRAILADTAVLANAPVEVIQAGYGDIIGKYSCLNDWRLAALVNGEYICDFVVSETYAQVEKTVALAEGIKARSPEAIGALMEALVAVGILMAYVGNSRPASGSEHHLSHYFEIVGILRNEPYLSHGIDVCHSAVLTAALRHGLAALESIDGLTSHHNPSVYQEDIRRIYGAIAEEIFALQDKLGWYRADRVSLYKEKWQDIRALLADSPTAEEMRALCARVGLSHEDFLAFYDEGKRRDSLLYAKDLKDRYSVLWLHYDLFSKKA
ncbi:MAG: sn-glycerol-1-phosphate dehydrogenase [Clostridia bacterium]|nr:sn-glycerol-1-phosphate dehydrogenase [Clostridia bacterium]